MLAAWLEGKEREDRGPIGVSTPSRTLQGLGLSTIGLTQWLAVWSAARIPKANANTNHRPRDPPFQSSQISQGTSAGRKFRYSVTKEKTLSRKGWDQP